MSKVFISPDDLREDSIKLGLKVLDTFRPDFMIALFRGGVPVGCYIHGLFKRHKLDTDYISVRTSKYTGVNTARDHVEVHGLAYPLEKIGPDTKLLIVDDISDTGLSVEALMTKLKEGLGDRMPRQENVKVATLYYKPSRNKSGRAPDYFVFVTGQWVVFPHEIEDMTDEEIETNMGSHLLSLITKKE